MKTEQKTCENCVYYLQHYIKENTSYQSIFCGHCVNNRFDGRLRKTDKICEYYQKRNKIKEKKAQLKSAAEYLAFISERLNELTEALKN